VALTGGIATGKSYCLSRFAAAGLPTESADRLARESVGPGTEGLAEVVGRFGTGVLAPDGSFDRKAFAARMFADDVLRLDLEAIVHPRVYAAITSWFADLERASPPPPAAVVEIPLLFETDHAGDFDVVIVAACPVDEQIARMTSSRGLTAEEARRQLAAQWPIDHKRALADIVIDTSGSKAATDRQVDEIARGLTAA
jgi:dephospho-CoA kinase